MSTEVTLVSPDRSGLMEMLKDAWNRRELLWFLAWKEIKVRYKQTAIGAAWAILQPLAAMLIFTLIFGRFVGVGSDGLPYTVFAYAALLPWFYFSQALTSGSLSLVDQREVITKIALPRILLPAAPLLSGLVDITFAFLAFLVLMAWYGMLPGPEIVFLPVFVFFAAVTAFAVSLWTSAACAFYRDVRYIVPFLVQIWMFASPVVYSSSLIPERWQFLYFLNPMAGVIEGFRWALLGSAPPGILICGSVATTVILLVGGLVFFRKMESALVDTI